MKKEKIGDKLIVRNTSEDIISPFNLDCFEILDETLKERSIDIKNPIWRDSREKSGKGWIFPKDDLCAGTEVRGLPTGDYTIAGFENSFIIERKGSTSEFSQNILEKRFENEMERLESFKFPFLICEFSYEDLVNFPINSGIPQRYWKRLKITPNFLISALSRYQIKFRTKFILAGSNGMKCAESLFRMMIKHGVRE